MFRHELNDIYKTANSLGGRGSNNSIFGDKILQFCSSANVQCASQNLEVISFL